MYSKILVAIDGSKQSKAALERAVEIAKCQDSKVHAVYAINPGIYGVTIVDPAIGVSDPGSERIFKMLQEEGEKIVAVLVEVWMPSFRERMETKAVNRTVTLPGSSATLPRSRTLRTFL